ncbi:hypothetical protein SuUB85_15280 [Streptococcus uberis]|uniref:hypothetical protein n=1 Tax=Streptococcus TaxID=1301 RepID=UPI003139CF20
MTSRECIEQRIEQLAQQNERLASLAQNQYDLLNQTGAQERHYQTFLQDLTF